MRAMAEKGWRSFSFPIEGGLGSHEQTRPLGGRRGANRRMSRWLSRSVLGIELASLCSDVGHEMATTAMPALLASLSASSAIRA
jgi:hypothetical protein